MRGTKGRYALLAAALVAFVPSSIAGSRDVNPLPLRYGERCISCLRPITDRFTAAEIVAPSQKGAVAYKFRTIRCMLAFLEDARVIPQALYVADYRDGTWLDVNRAVFVRIDIDAATGQPHYGIGDSDFAAFGEWKAADQFAAARGVATMSWLAAVIEATTMPRHDQAR